MTVDQGGGRTFKECMMFDTVKDYFPSRILHAQGLFRVQDISLE